MALSFNHELYQPFVTLEECYIHKTSEKAIQVTYDNLMLWIPRSCIQGHGSKLQKWQQDIDLQVAEWFANKHIPAYQNSKPETYHQPTPKQPEEFIRENNTSGQNPTADYDHQ